MLVNASGILMNEAKHLQLQTALELLSSRQCLSGLSC